MKKLLARLAKAIPSPPRSITLDPKTTSEFLSFALLTIIGMEVLILAMQAFLIDENTPVRAGAIIASMMILCVAYLLSINNHLSWAVGILGVHGYGFIFAFALIRITPDARTLYFLSTVVIFVSLFLAFRYAVGMWLIALMGIVLYGIVQHNNNMPVMMNGVFLFNFVTGFVVLLLIFIRQSAEHARQQQILDATKSLSDSHQMIEGITRTVPDIIYVYDVKTHVNLYMNEAIESVLGYPYAYIISLNPGILQTICHPDDFARYEQHLQSLFTAKDGEVKDLTARVKHKDGSWRLLTTRETVFKRTVSGVPAQILGVAQDNTERRLVEERNLQLRLERERVHLLSNFVRDASHEFRTPLSVISSNVYLLTRMTEPEAKQARVQVIEEQILSISHLLDMLLMMSKLDSDITPRTALTDVNLLIRQIVAPMQSEQHKNYHPFQLELDENLNLIMADVSLLQEALLQLVDNAVRYCEKNQPVRIVTEQRAEQVYILIDDKGIGLSDIDKKRMFERFYRGDSAHSTRGFGLGLPIALKVVELHNGRIATDGETGKGCRVEVFLPII